MKVWASFNDDGFPAAFYIDALFPEQPEGTTAVTEDQWRDMVDNQGRRKFVAGEVVHYDPPPSPLPVPASISDRQFFQQLAIEGRISNQEALDAVKTGAIPAVLQSFVDALPADEKFDAEMLLSGAVEFRRDHWMTEAVGEAQDMTSEQVDDFFRVAGAL